MSDFATPWTVTYQAPLSMEWVAISFSKGSSRARDQTPVAHIVGRRFAIRATRELLSLGDESCWGEGPTCGKGKKSERRWSRRGSGLALEWLKCGARVEREVVMAKYVWWVEVSSQSIWT